MYLQHPAILAQYFQLSLPPAYTEVHTIIKLKLCASKSYPIKFKYYQYHVSTETEVQATTDNQGSEPACFGATPAPGEREHNVGIFLN